MNKSPLPSPHTPKKCYAWIAFNLPIRKQFVYHYPAEWELLPGAAVRAPFGSKLLTGFVVATTTDKPPLEGNIIIRSLKTPYSGLWFGPHTMELAQYLCKYYFCSLGEMLFSMVPLQKTALPQEAVIPPLHYQEPSAAITLNTAQQSIAQELWQKTGQISYLKGPTGSGKTEVFLYLAKRALKEGKTLVLVLPEITMCQQLKERILTVLEEKYTQQFVVYHSSLKPQARSRIVQRILKNEVLFVLGTRSALLLPLSQVDYICIDEEHATTYKSSHSPRYHALTVALWYQKRHNTTIVLASATPSLEMYYRIQEKHISCYQLESGVYAGSASVHVVDLNKEQHIFSKKTATKTLSPQATGATEFAVSQ